MPWIGGAFEGS